MAEDGSGCSCTWGGNCTRIGFVEKVTSEENGQQAGYAMYKRRAVGARRLVTEVYWFLLFIH